MNFSAAAIVSRRAFSSGRAEKLTLQARIGLIVIKLQPNPVFTFFGKTGYS
jgi:hypothetical protein